MFAKMRFKKFIAERRKESGFWRKISLFLASFFMAFNLYNPSLSYSQDNLILSRNSSQFKSKNIAVLPQNSIYTMSIGDIDNDGENELLSGTSPDSRLYVSKYDKKSGKFRTELLEEKLAGFGCDNTRTNVSGNLSNILITDINYDGKNEIIAMTDQQLEDSNLKFWVFSKKDNGWFKNSIEVISPSHWTHGLAAYDTDGNGIQEVFSTHELPHTQAHTQALPVTFS